MTANSIAIRGMGEAVKSLKILIVEDEMFLAMDLESHLETLGHKVIGIASDAQESLALASATEPDLALVDLNLRDGLTGPEIAAKLTRDYSTLVVFVTGNPEQIPYDYAGALGAITKPWDPTTLEQLATFVSNRAVSGGDPAELPVKMAIAPSLSNRTDR